MCENDADGGHQCGGCFRHMHGFCGEPWPESEEGFGQVRMCGGCTSEGQKQVAASFTPEGSKKEMPPAPTEEPSFGDNEPFDFTNADCEGSKDDNIYIARADFDDLMRKGIAYLNRNFDDSGRQKLTPEDAGYSVFLRLQKLDPGPDMDQNEYYALRDIIDGPQTKDEGTPKTTAATKKLHQKGSAGKQQWAESLMRGIQNSKQAEETLKRPRSEDSHDKKLKKKHKKRTKNTSLHDVDNVDVPHESKKGKKKKKKASGVGAINEADGVADSKEPSVGADGPKKKKKRKKLSREETGAKLGTYVHQSVQDIGIEEEVKIQVARALKAKEEQELNDKEKKRRFKVLRTNTRVRNWQAGMRRNFDNDAMKKALDPFTITRNKMHKVRNCCICCGKI